MLIGVTHFFRDPETFRALAKELRPDFLAPASSLPQWRTWVVGCATGEEAYSIAMLLNDLAFERQSRRPIQVFASDIDDRALEIARAGVYQESDVAFVDDERRRRYFDAEADAYRIRKAVREQLLFARHNALRDPPFSRVDLITCRNLLIYLEREAQSELLELFHFALNPGGLLLLGGAESADFLNDHFAVVDKKHRLYRSLPKRRARHELRPLRAAPTAPVSGAVPVAQPLADLHQRLLDDRRASVVLDAQRHVMHTSGGVARYLRHVDGEPSQKLLDLLLPSLAAALRPALLLAGQTGQRVASEPVRLGGEQSPCELRMSVFPAAGSAGKGVLLVVFEEVDASIAPLGGEAPAQVSGYAALEAELQRVQADLYGRISDSTASGEALRAANEELQSINEELRSASEELETRKEELQSVNEELTTVNFELKHKVEETAQINGDLTNLITSMNIATVFVDRSLQIRGFTPVATNVFNILSTDVGRPLSHLTHRLKYDALPTDVAKVLKELRPVELEVAATDGRWYLARLSPYRTGDDRIDGAVLNFIDVTERRAAEERVRVRDERVRRELEAANAMRSEFLAVLSHELKNPLNLILMNAELIRRLLQLGAVPQVARAAETISRTVHSQSQIIDDLLDLSRLHTGKLTLNRHRVGVRPVVERIVEALANDAAESRIVVRCELDEIDVNADMTRVEQIVWNLLTNALKFTPPEGRVDVRLRRDGPQAVLEVADTGRGIEGDLLPLVFDMFKQGDGRSTTRRDGGLGIGLALVRSLAELHGGGAEARSAGVGQGATFIVRLPIEEGPATVPAAVRAVEHGLAGRRILLVDDDAPTLETFAEVLRVEGAQVTTAGNAEAALAAADAADFDLLISDIAMPGFDGLQLIAALRAAPRAKDWLAVAVTGFGRAEDAERARLAGFDGHLAKPLSFDRLADWYGRALRQRQC